MITIYSKCWSLLGMLLPGFVDGSSVASDFVKQ